MDNTSGRCPFVWGGLLDFAQARSLQSEHRDAILRGESEGVVLLCEHPKTLSAGKRTKEDDLPADLKVWCENGAQFVRTDRGGSATLHLPGQLVLYPTFNLRHLGLGVKRFVSLGLEALTKCVQNLGVQAAAARLDPAGVWVEDRKIASVGLRIERGVSMHGFSLNVACELDEFRSFSPCGIAACPVTSVVEEGGGPLDDLAHHMTQSWRDTFGC